MSPQYTNLLWPEAAPITPGKKPAPAMHRRGCAFCPRNGADGIRKIKGHVRGKKLFTWAQSPGPTENEVGKELVGKAGKWFWKEMEAVGLTRDDCDIQNMVRCYPADEVHGRLVMRDPTKEEIFCCSLYTDQAIVKSRAKVHIVLGQIAAKQLFGKSFKRDSMVFWSDKLNGRVVVLDHPSYLMRAYVPEHRRKQFRYGLKAVVRMLAEPAGRFGFLRAKNYEGVTTVKHARDMKRQILAAAAKGERIAADIEEGWVNGEWKALCYGFAFKKNHAWTVALDHPLVDVKQRVRRKLKRIVRSILSNPNVKKVCHHGSHDQPESEKLLGGRFRSYDFDTNYSEYFKWPGRRSYALAEITKVRFPEFSGYKEVIMPEAAPEGWTYQKASKAGKLNFAKIPWKKLVLYNGADCDLTKRIEKSTQDVALPLLKVYQDAAFTLDWMEKNGPYFDYKQCEALAKIYPFRIKKKAQQLQVLAGDPHFKPGSPQDVARIIYDVLDLEPINKGNRSTAKNILELLSTQHPLPKLQIEYRKDVKLDSTYRKGFKKCADEHKGRLFTKWWLTGTKTGRISSGGSKDGEEITTVNLQNIHGDPQVQNMLVSDRQWRDIYNKWKEDGEYDPKWYREFWDRQIYLALDYSQNELRFFAQSSGDEALIEQFNQDEDIHCLVGNEITGWSVEVIAKDKQKRKLIKNFHFGLLYGLTEDGMLNYLKVNGIKSSKSEVHDMMTRYFKKYKRVKEFIRAKHEEARRFGYVTNILGFKCPIHVPEDEDERTGGAFWANQAVNTPIQGGAHQLLLMALASLKRKRKTYALIRTPNMEIHDSIVCSVALRDLREATKQAVYLLEQEVLNVLRNDFGLKWKIPLKAEPKVGFRFGVTVDYTPESKIGPTLVEWCKANKKSNIALQKELQAAEKLAA